MQSEFSHPPTQLEAVLWFLRVESWLSVVYLVSSFGTPFYSRGFGILSFLSLQSLIISGLPLLVLWFFPRLLAFASLGARARDPLALRSLLGRCIGLSLFVRSLGSAVFLSLEVAEALYSRGGLGFGGGYYWLYFRSPLTATTVLSFFLGFFLAFGPAIRDNFRAR